MKMQSGKYDELLDCYGKMNRLTWGTKEKRGVLSGVTGGRARVL